MAEKKTLVLGATGGTGRHVVEYAVQQGHDVTVLVRDVQRFDTSRTPVRVLQGDMMADDGSVEAAVHGQEVVISVLGRGTSFSSGGLIRHSLERVVRAMERAGVRRLIVTSAFGVGATYDAIPLGPRIFSRLALRDIYRDKLAGEAFVRASDLDWTLVYPSALTGRPGTGRWRAGEHLPLRGFPSIPRADLARFLVTQIDDRTYVKKGVLVSS